MNSFAKFREWLKSNKMYFKFIFHNYLNAFYMVKESLDIIKSENKSVLPKSITDAINLLYKKLNIKTVHDKVETIEDFIDNIKNDIKYSEDTIKEMTNLINSFDNDGCIRKIDSLKLLLFYLVKAIMEESITIDDATKIVGAAIYYNGKKSKDINYKTLASCFNRDGSFKLGYPVSDFVTAINTVYAGSASRKLDNLEILENKAKEIINYIINAYDVFYTEGLLKQENKVSEVQQKVYLKEDLAIKDIDNPNTNDLFDELELEIINSSSIILENMKKNNAWYYSLLEILTDINAIKAIWLEVSMEEKAEILTLKEEALANLRTIIANMKTGEKLTTNNLIFLNDGNSNCYFASDFENIDKGLRLSVLKLLGKITPDNTKNFRPIKSNIYKITDLYEVLNGTGHIMFKYLGNGIYLVIGAGIKADDYYAKSVRRVMDPETKKYLEELLLELSNEEKRNKILLEQEEIRANIVEGIKNSR